ncbi:MAG: M48 family metallopeptidase [Candidatus Margulisbacteria bacterium]|nr:M48 family metallopeptidase [Candidatus Margulisiibacteriota bacterium]
MELEIIKSPKRKKTISARLVNNTIRVNAPANISEEKLAEAIKKLRSKLEKRQLKRELNAKKDLSKIAQALNRKYFGNIIRFASIEYTANQNRLFGSCNHRTRIIRLSHRLAKMPDWVRDYVIIHELAHILVPNHSQAFWELVYRYELTERARGFLIAQGFEAEADLV